jgi:hypothetical protein
MVCARADCGQATRSRLFPLHFGQLVPAAQQDSVIRQLRDHRLAITLRLPAQHGKEFLTQLPQARVLLFRPSLPQQGYALHEELVEIRGKDCESVARSSSGVRSSSASARTLSLKSSQLRIGDHGFLNGRLPPTG